MTFSGGIKRLLSSNSVIIDKMRLPVVPEIDTEYTRCLVNSGAEIVAYTNHVGCRNNEETGLSESESESIQR